MEKRKKRLAVAIVILNVFMMLGGCSRFDAVAYTQAVLDASYKNQTEHYIELVEVDKKAADAIFQNNLDTTMEEFKTEKLSEELENDYRTLFEAIIKQVKYTVGESKKEENGSYAVKISVKPMTLFDDTYQNFQKKAEEYAAEVTNSVMNGAAMPTDEEIQEHVYRLYYEILKAELDAGVNYAKAESLVIHVVKKEDGGYEINRKDLQVLDGKLISRKVMTEEMK